MRHDIGQGNQDVGRDKKDLVLNPNRPNGKSTTNDKLKGSVPKNLHMNVASNSSTKNSVSQLVPRAIRVSNQPRISDPSIKTAMNIQKVGPNQFIFTNEPDPLDSAMGTPMNEEVSNSEAVECMEETQNVWEVAVSTPTH